jgi:imidazoleglycerol-phosphate dehydratase
MDEAKATTSIDISGRPSLTFKANLNKEKTGEFDSELVEEFFKAFVNNAQLSLHIEQKDGENLHHQVEAIFKSFAKALDIATQIDERAKDQVPSTKGIL